MVQGKVKEDESIMSDIVLMRKDGKGRVKSEGCNCKERHLK